MGRPSKAKKAVETGKTRTQPSRSCTALAAPYDAIQAEGSTRSSKKMPSNGAKKATTKRKSARVSKKNPWGEEFLTTNPDSPIVDVDLVKLLSKANSWTSLDEDEKKEILAQLPASLNSKRKLNPDDPECPNPPLPEEFLRYSNVWRDGVRQFQADLENGKYEPVWQRRATQASEERARGKFDKWKEDQFEQFWGQKQKFDKKTVAGESASVKLETLVKNGVVRVGDVWKYCAGRRIKGQTVLIEKEVLIIGSDGSSLTFAIPSGQRVILIGDANDAVAMQPSPSAELRNQQPAIEVIDSSPEPDNKVDKKELSQAEPGSITEPMDPVIASVNEIHPEFLSQLNEAAHETDVTKEDGVSADQSSNVEDFPAKSPTESTVVEDEDQQSSAPEQTVYPETMAVGEKITVSSTGADAEDSEANEIAENNLDTSPKNSVLSTATSSQTKILETEGSKMIIDEESAKTNPNMVVLSGVKGPAPVARRIHEVDGRTAYGSHCNSWKDFRCYRTNQDMGCLWDLRQTWYIRSQR